MTTQLEELKKKFSEEKGYEILESENSFHIMQENFEIMTIRKDFRVPHKDNSDRAQRIRQSTMWSNYENNVRENPTMAAKKRYISLTS